MSIDSSKILSKSRAHENIGQSRSQYKQMRVKRFDSERLDVVLTVSDDRRSLSQSRAPLAPRSVGIWVRIRLYVYKNACICIKKQGGKKNRKHEYRRAGMWAHNEGNILDVLVAISTDECKKSYKINKLMSWEPFMIIVSSRIVST